MDGLVEDKNKHTALIDESIAKQTSK